MKYPYNLYSKEELLTNPKIELIVLENAESVFQSMAIEMVEEIKKNNKLGKRTVYICPVGPTGQYPYFIEMVNVEKISLKNVWFINMDEYLDYNKKWISKEDSLSFRGYMEREVYSKIDSDLIMPEEQRIFPDPEHPHLIADLIEELGGVDIAFGGIGINGHVAFNEPQDNLTVDEFRNLKTRVLEVSPETITVNAISSFNGAINEIPKYCVTLGLYEIFNARKVRFGCFRDWHRAVVRRAAHGEKTTSFPITLFQDHPDVNIKMPEFVANL